MTVSELLRRALVLARVIADGEPVAGPMQKDALDTMVDMLEGWAESGLDLAVPETIETGDELPLARSKLRAVRYNLARELCAEYKTPLDPRVDRIATESLMMLATTALGDMPAEYDRALWRDHTYDINEG